MRRLLLLVLAALVVVLAGAPVATALPAADPSSPVDRQARTALFFGDSYFVGGGCSPDAQRGMAELAGVQLGYAPVVRGAGGTGFVQANPDYGIPPYLAQIREGAFDVPDPALVVVEGGSNDVGRSLHKIERNARKVLLIARKRFPGALVVLVGPMQTYGPYSDTDAIRDGLKTVSRRLGIGFVNPQRWTDGHDDWLCDDYVHPTYAGHVELGQRLAAALRKRGA